ncbi:YhgE/Pip domain-containing protein [Microbacter sp. GSS18]|nr:YhgE/Pip domain-containing protein [Microbacter sp. GSS18]
MTLPIERARTRKPITWLTIIGVVLLPVIIGGLLIAALYNPTERLESINAAIVNDDDPVTIDGQMVPLGRQLTAGLVGGSDEVDSNLTWTITNAEDASEGLADGDYAAVVTIPSNFSAAATSTMPGETPEQAIIEVTTPPDSLIVDDAITAQIAQTAASVLGEQLSQAYLENVLLGFTTLGDELGTAADGASELADGTRGAADGTVSLADGVAQLSTGANGLAGGAGDISSGVGQLAGGARELADGADGIASGADGIASGAAQLSSGTAASAAGLQEWAAGARDLADGTQQLSDGITSMIPEIPADALDRLDQIAENSDAISANVSAAAEQLAQLSADCLAEGGTQELCDAVAQVSAQVDGALPAVTGVLENADTIAEAAHGIADGTGPLIGGLNSIAGGMSDLADGADDAAAGVGQLAVGMSSLSDGAADLGSGTATWAAGARSWADGADQTAAGVSTWSSGASSWSAGASDAAAGAGDLADGMVLLADGTGELADGLHTAVDEIPTYTDEEAADTATVVSNPVAADGVGSSLFGMSAIPLLAMLALWFGGLASFVALQAVSGRTLASRMSSPTLALRALAPAVALGAIQGVLVAGVVQLAAQYDWGDWWVFALVCVVAGVAFAAVNQALVAVFGAAGHGVSALVGVLAVATGIVSTVPGVLTSIASLMPTAPAYNAMIGALTAAGGVTAGIVGLVVWALLALAVTIVAVTRRRTVSARRLLASAPA